MMEISNEDFIEILEDYFYEIKNKYWVFNPLDLPDKIDFREYEIGIDYLDKPKVIHHDEWRDDSFHDAWEKVLSITELSFEDIGYKVVIENSLDRLVMGGDTENDLLEVKVYKDVEVSDTDVKKYLLKGKPEASFDFIRKGKAYYYIDTFTAEGLIPTGRITFEIPIEDMGDADFKSKMDGNLLLRWIYSYTQKK